MIVTCFYIFPLRMCRRVFGVVVSVTGQCGQCVDTHRTRRAFAPHFTLMSCLHILNVGCKKISVVHP